MKSFLLMLSFFTRIPVRARMDVGAAHFEKGIKYLFIIAIIVGAGHGGPRLFWGSISGRISRRWFRGLFILMITGGPAYRRYGGYNGCSWQPS